MWQEYPEGIAIPKPEKHELPEGFAIDFERGCNINGGESLRRRRKSLRRRGESLLRANLMTNLNIATTQELLRLCTKPYPSLLHSMDYTQSWRRMQLSTSEWSEKDDTEPEKQELQEGIAIPKLEKQEYQQGIAIPKPEKQELPEGFAIDFERRCNIIGGESLRRRGESLPRANLKKNRRANLKKNLKNSSMALAVFRQVLSSVLHSTDYNHAATRHELSSLLDKMDYMESLSRMVLSTRERSKKDGN